MVKVSIICLIYKSTALADWVYNSALQHTPKLATGEAEFLFVANDASTEVLTHLSKKNLPHIAVYNEQVPTELLFAAGYAKPEYISRVYRGYNQGILAAKGEVVVLINSDHAFSENWLENLLKYLSRNTIVSSKLVEPQHAHFPLFPDAHHGEFGTTTSSFDEIGFATFAHKHSVTGIEPGGAYMPCALHKDNALLAGLYPSGNLAGSSWDDVAEYGDKAFFSRLAKLGIAHITALDSVVYHLKEGEVGSKDADSPASAPAKTQLIGVSPWPASPSGTLYASVVPTPSHSSILDALAKSKRVKKFNKRKFRAQVYQILVRLRLAKLVTRILRMS